MDRLPEARGDRVEGRNRRPSKFRPRHRGSGRTCAGATTRSGPCGASIQLRICSTVCRGNAGEYRGPLRSAKKTGEGDPSRLSAPTDGERSVEGTLVDRPVWIDG
jgi:hypothetical protein